MWYYRLPIVKMKGTNYLKNLEARSRKMIEKGVK